MPLEYYDETHTFGTHIVFEQVGLSPSAKTCRFDVKTTDDAAFTLGVILWHSPWRKYTFHPIITNQTLYEETCLRDIADFVEMKTKAHYRKLKELKAVK